MLDFLNEPGTVLPVFLGAFIDFQEAGDSVGFGFFPLSPGNIAVVPIVPDHLFAPARDVETHGRQPLQGIEDLFLASLLRPVNHL
jgi:hypothetical protein